MWHLSLDGSENGEIHIESIEEYELSALNEITEFELDSESKIEDDEDNFQVIVVVPQKMNLVIK